MANKQKEPANMIEFMITELSEEDREIAEKVKPLPATVIPSTQFIASTRETLLAAIEGVRGRAAA